MILIVFIIAGVCLISCIHNSGIKPNQIASYEKTKVADPEIPSNSNIEQEGKK